MKYPFIFIKTSDELPNEAQFRVFVKIASFDLAPYRSAWMGDSDLGESCWVPDVDLTYEKYEFRNEIEALRFIQQWWAKQDLSEDLTSDEK